MNLINFLEKLKVNNLINYSIDSSKIYFKYKYDDLTHYYPEDGIEDIIEQEVPFFVSQTELTDEFNHISDWITIKDPIFGIIYKSGTKCELLLESESPYSRSYFDTGKITLNDYTFEIKSPSNIFNIHFIDNIIDLGLSQKITSKLTFNLEYDEIPYGNSINNFYDLIKSYLKSYFIATKTLHISHNLTMDSNQIRDLCLFFLFSLSKNHNIHWTPVESLENYYVEKTLEPYPQTPKQFKLEPKIFHYYPSTLYILGKTRHDPFERFLLFYQVIEYFFSVAESDRKRELTADLLKQINAPNPPDTVIEKFIADISTKTDKKPYEKDALYSLIERYCKDFSNIQQCIKQINPNFLLQIESSSTCFISNGSNKNLDFSSQNIGTRIADRIYTVRNAIVHRKGDEQDIYNPLTDKKALIIESSLVQAVAEEILLESSTNI